VHPPGPIIASGRDADIFEYGPHSVLKRSRHQKSVVIEARVMDYVRGQGYPVPAIEEVSDDGWDLVMQRVDGRSMIDTVSRQPWTIRRQGSVLADLHRRLHEIPAPDWLPAAPFGAGDELLHFDLHPLNVLITAAGPVVIDWPNVVRGDGAGDVALTWVIMAAAEVPAGPVMGTVMGWGRGMVLSAFLRPFDRDAVRRRLRGAVAWKVADPNISAAEKVAMQRLADREALAG